MTKLKFYRLGEDPLSLAMKAGKVKQKIEEKKVKEKTEQLDESVEISLGEQISALSEEQLDQVLAMIEESEELNEISKTTLSSYVQKAKASRTHNQSEVDRHNDLSDTAYQKRDFSKADHHTDKADHHERNVLKRSKGISKANKKLGEEIEQIDEISKKTLGSYYDKRSDQLRKKRAEMNAAAYDDPEGEPKRRRQYKGLQTAIDKTKNVHGVKVPAKEEVEHLDEISKKTLGSYIKKASKQVQRKSDDALNAQSMGNSTHDKRVTINKRTSGIQKAVNKMVKEEIHEEVEMLDEEFLALFEDLGAFKGLSSDLLRPFKTFGYKSSKDGVFGSYADKGLSRKFGRESEFREASFKNAEQFNKQFVANKDEFAGYVIKVDGEAVLTVSIDHGTGYKAKTEVKRAFNKKAIEAIGVSTTISSEFDKASGKAGLLGPKIMAQLIMNAASAKGKSVSGFFITVDKNRKAMGTERATARKGAIAMMSPDEVRKLYRDQLLTKLKAFKLSKNEVSVASKEEIKTILDKKFPKTFSIKVDDLEVFYELYQIRYLDAAVYSKIKGESKSYDPVAEYNVTDTSQKTIRDYMKKNHPEYDDDHKNAAKDLSEKYPNRIEVALSVSDDLSIKPVSIKYQKGWWY